MRLLQTFADNLLRLYPEQASSLGVDTGARAALRSRLEDRSAAGQEHIASVVKADLRRAEAIDTSRLSFETRTSVEVVKYAYRTKLQGLALPYGDAPVAGDSWRNTPYVVIQNAGSYIDTPQFLDTDHPIETRADAEAYLARLAQYPRELDGEVGRIRAARKRGLVPPTFLIDATIKQLGIALKDAAGRRRLVDSLVTRTKAKGIAGDWDSRARRIVTSRGRARAPAPDRRNEGRASRRDGHPRHVVAPAWRGILRLGAQGLDHHRPHPGPGPPNGPPAAQ